MAKRLTALLLSFLALAPAWAQEIRISADRRALDFGIVQTGSSRTLQIDVVNRGSDQLTLTCSGGALEGPFSQSNGCFGSVLSSDEFCSVEYTFSPDSVFSVDAQADLICNGLPITVDITARSESPRLGARVRHVDLGEVSVNDPTATRFTVNISNFGRSRVSLQCSNEVIDDPAFNVTLNACDGVSISPGGSCAYEIGFLPTTPGPVSATFAPRCLGVSLPIQLEGMGVAGTPGQTLYAQTRDLNFGPIPLNESLGTVFGSRVTNRGPPQNVICTGGGVDSPFTNGNECNNVMLNTMGRCFLTFTAFTTTPGEFFDNSVYTCNGQIFDISLSARAELPSLQFDAPVLQFDAVSTDRPFVSAVVMLTNQGFNRITADCTASTEQLPFAVSNLCNGEVLLPGGSCVFAYAFFPTDLGDFADTSLISCNGVELAVGLRGTAVSPPPIFLDGFEVVPTLP